MLRSLSIIAAVAALAATINHLESAPVEQPSQVSQISWVRTVDGWQPSSVLTAGSEHTPRSLHPFLVASFELGASLFALVAFPSRKS